MPGPTYSMLLAAIASRGEFEAARVRHVGGKVPGHFANDLDLLRPKVSVPIKGLYIRTGDKGVSYEPQRQPELDVLPLASDGT